VSGVCRMSSLPSAMVPSFQTCRQAARAVRSAQAGRQAMALSRPRGIAAVRSRAPLALQIRLAALEGRLVWRGPDAFAVIEAPTSDRSSPGARRGTKMLRFADRYWDQLILGMPALLALILAAGLAFVPATRIAALLAALFVVAWVTLVVLALVVTGFAWLYRILIVGHPRDLAEQAISQLRGAALVDTPATCQPSAGGHRGSAGCLQAHHGTRPSGCGRAQRYRTVSRTRRHNSASTWHCPRYDRSDATARTSSTRRRVRARSAAPRARHLTRCTSWGHPPAAARHGGSAWCRRAAGHGG
jgi:membrane protein implicated in regulation of membrane protease activity